MLAREGATLPLLERTLLLAKEAAAADGGSIYLVDDRREVRFALALSDTLGLHLGGTVGGAVDIEAPPLFNADGTANDRSVITHCVHERRTLNMADAYDTPGRDYAARARVRPAFRLPDAVGAHRTDDRPRRSGHRRCAAR